MKVTHFSNINTVEIKEGNVNGVQKRVLVSAKDGAPNFTMRMFTVAPGGYTFHHAHNFEHEIYIVEGKGEVQTDEASKLFEKDYVLFIDPNKMHQIRNTGDSPLRFLCLIPNANER